MADAKGTACSSEQYTCNDDIKPENSILTDLEKGDIELIWKLLDRSRFLDDLHPHWPAENVIILRQHIIPVTDPSLGCMPLSFAHFIKIDLRSITLEHRTDWLEMNMAVSTIEYQFKDYFISVLHKFLVIWTNCDRPRTRGRSSSKKRIETILKNIEGLDLFPEDSDGKKPADEETQDNKDNYN